MKKIISLLIAIAILMSLVTVNAASLKEEQITYLAENGIMVGDPDGNLRLEDTITRAEASKVLSVTFDIEGEEGETFADVDDSHWAKGYIAAMKKSGIINGYPDGTFKPENQVTYAEFVKMTVEAVGKGDEAMAHGGYPDGYIAVAKKLGILEDIAYVNDAAAIRKDIATILYNSKDMKALHESNLYIMGDSLADTFPDTNYPLQGWGTFLGDYFKDEMVVHNRARNGWTTKTYLTVGQHADYPDKSYWEVIRDELVEGDWLLIALGINDCSLSNKFRTTEEEYKANLTLFTNEARAKGVNVMFMTQSIKGGDDNSEAGWDYVLPSDGIPMDENVPMEQRWVRRAKVLTDIGAELNVPTVQFGKYLSELYESMYQEYMTAHPDATAGEGRNYVRYHFHIYNKNINDEIANGGFGLNLPDKADDSTHTNIRGSKEYASIIAKLISETDTELAKYVLEEGDLAEKTLFIMGASKESLMNKNKFPMQGWGPFMQDNVKEQLAVKNFATSGWTTESFRIVGLSAEYPNETMWDVMKKEFKAGDWLLMTFGVNDASLTNLKRTDEQKFADNVKFFTEEARALGVNVIYMTVAINGGTDGSEEGWDYILPSDGIPMDENVPMYQRWVRRSKVFKDIGTELGVPVIEFGKYLATYYEDMYQKYMSANPDATVAEGRNYVRYHFHLYNKNLNASTKEGGWGLNVPNKADDATHTNITAAREYAAIISNLISEMDIELADYMSSLIDIYK